MTKQEIIKILKENKYKIERNDYYSFYQDLNNLTEGTDISQFTEIFLKSNIDPLDYMEYVPDNYLYDTDSPISIIDSKSLKETSYIGDYAFAFTTNLFKANLEKPLSLGDNVFRGSYNLETLIFPDMSYIPKGTCYNCPNLKDIYIPKTINFIGSFSFYDCPNIENIYYEGSEDDWRKIDFNGIANSDLYEAKNIYFNIDRDYFLSKVW